jgi:hypothetical protein
MIFDFAFDRWTTMMKWWSRWTNGHAHRYGFNTETENTRKDPDRYGHAHRYGFNTGEGDSWDRLCKENETNCRFGNLRRPAAFLFKRCDSLTMIPDQKHSLM